MPSVDNLALFAAASLLLALTPGPNLLYLVSRTLCQGRRAGIVSLAGTSLGFFFHMLAAALGLSAIFLAVPLLYDLLRYAGAAYLLWLAWGAIRQRAPDMFAARSLPQAPTASLFRMGFLTSVLNPKLALFYLALLPQFVDPSSGSVLAQSVILGLIQIAIGAVSDLCFVLAAARIAAWLARRPFWSAAQRWILGGLFAAIALRLAFDARK
ncbi:MAG TPA: LysE family translocator [Casimicrobiaceae bacterium]|nr:LysE family translocator [Casimicrobiaceae bacterium]